MKKFSMEKYELRTITELPTITGIRPNFYLIPCDKEAGENQIVRFELRVSGRPEPEISWFKDDKQILDSEHFKIVVNEEGSHALLIMGADPCDTGTYKCIASNSNGEASFTVKLIVYAKAPTSSPKFIDQLQNVSVKASETLTLYCRAVGKPNPKFIWLKDGQNIESNPPNIIIESDETSSKIIVSNVSVRDAGWYQCTAQNQAGSNTSRARVNVDFIHQIPQGEPIKIILPKTHRIIEHEPETYETVHLKHVLRYYEEIPPESNEFITYEEQKTKPIFAKDLKDVTLMKNNTAHFEAYLQAPNYSDLKIEWYLNDKLIENSEEFLITDRFGYVAMTIIHVQPNQTGLVKCKAINPYGEAVTIANLKCFDETPETFPKSMLYVEAQNLSNQTRSIGFEKVDDNKVAHKPLPGQDYYEKYEEIEDSEFYCEKREIEETYSKIGPHFVRPLKSNLVSNQNNTIMLEAKVTPVNDPSMRIEWYFNDQPLVLSDRISSKFENGLICLKIENLQVSDSGLYTVRAINSANEANSNSNITVHPGKAFIYNMQ